MSINFREALYTIKQDITSLFNTLASRISTSTGEIFHIIQNVNARKDSQSKESISVTSPDLNAFTYNDNDLNKIKNIFSSDVEKQISHQALDENRSFYMFQTNQLDILLSKIDMPNEFVFVDKERQINDILIALSKMRKETNISYIRQAIDSDVAEAMKKALIQLGTDGKASIEKGERILETLKDELTIATFSMKQEFYPFQLNRLVTIVEDRIDADLFQFDAAVKEIDNTLQTLSKIRVSANVHKQKEIDDQVGAAMSKALGALSPDKKASSEEGGRILGMLNSELHRIGFSIAPGQFGLL